MIIFWFVDGDVDIVLFWVNVMEFGLVFGVFIRDINKVLYVSDKFQVGIVFVNMYNKIDVVVFFGGFKQFGFGKDLGEVVLNEYLWVKIVIFEY